MLFFQLQVDATSDHYKYLLFKYLGLSGQAMILTNKFYRGRQQARGG